MGEVSGPVRNVGSCSTCAHALYVLITWLQYWPASKKHVVRASLVDHIVKPSLYNLILSVDRYVGFRTAPAAELRFPNPIFLREP